MGEEKERVEKRIADPTHTHTPLDCNIVFTVIKYSNKD